MAEANRRDFLKALFPVVAVAACTHLGIAPAIAQDNAPAAQVAPSSIPQPRFVYGVDPSHPATVQFIEPGKHAHIATVYVAPNVLKSPGFPAGASPNERVAIKIARDKYAAAPANTTSVVWDTQDLRHPTVQVGPWRVDVYNYDDDYKRPERHEGGILAFNVVTGMSARMKFWGWDSVFDDNPYNMRLPIGGGPKRGWTVELFDNVNGPHDRRGHAIPVAVYNQAIKETTVNSQMSGGVYNGVIPDDPPALKEAISAAERAMTAAEQDSQASLDRKFSGRGHRQISEILSLQ